MVLIFLPDFLTSVHFRTAFYLVSGIPPSYMGNGKLFNASLVLGAKPFIHGWPCYGACF